MQRQRLRLLNEGDEWVVTHQHLPSRGRDDLIDEKSMRVTWAISVVSPVSNASFIFCNSI
jgi:hypothetical protein